MERQIMRWGAVALLALALGALAWRGGPAPLAAESLERGGADVATATVHAGGVDILPGVRHRGGVVTLSGNGRVFQQRIEPGASATIGVFDPEGQLLPDGVYTWEVELYPDARTARRLREAALRNDGRAPGAWRRQTGTLTLKNGLVASPDEVEAGLSRRPESAGKALPMALTRPIASRRPALDDDAAVGSRTGVEAAVNAAGRSGSPPPAAGRSQLAGESVGRTDAASLALGRSLERAPAPAAVAAGIGVEVRPVRRSTFDNTDRGANGRDRSDER